VCVRVTEADGWVRVDRFHVQPTLAGLRSLIARLAEDAGQNFDTPMARISSSRAGHALHAMSCSSRRSAGGSGTAREEP
jgi:hypothetical protein